MKNHFFVYDVETANEGRDSLCEIAVVEVVNNKMCDFWQTRVNPETKFNPFNTRIHRISEETVKDSPKIPQVLEEFRSRVTGSTVVSHSNFDQTVIRSCIGRFKSEVFDYSWADSINIISSVWAGLPSYGLENLAKHFNLTYHAHHAIDDARVAAILTINALTKSKTSIENWVCDNNCLEGCHEEYKPTELKDYSQYSFLGNDIEKIEVENAKGVIVFTGELTISRLDAAERAVSAGYSVHRKVTKKTTILVRGEQDLDRLAGYQNSTKERYAEKLISAGLPIKIISQKEFMTLIQ